MNFKPKNTNNVPEPSQESLEELLRRMAPELGLEVGTPETRRGHHFRYRLLHCFPKALAAALLCMVLVLTALLLLAPPELRDVTVEEGDGFHATVSFQLGRTALIGGVTVRLDGRPIPVTHDGIGRSYQATVSSNGEMLITVETMAGRTVMERVNITSIDEDPPTLSNEKRKDGEIFIYVTDGDGTGVDWDSVSAVYVDTGESFDQVYTDRDAGCIRFVIPAETVRIGVSDRAGNRLSMRLGVAADN